MSFYKLFGGISGSSDVSTKPTGTSSISGAETIERLCDRVQSASLIEDRRDALIEIKSLSKKYKLEVGTHAMPILIDVLDQFRSDSEIACLALDSLYNIMTTDKSDDLEQPNLPADITSQFTEMFIKTSTNLNLIFDLLDEFEFKTRWNTVKLLDAFILNQSQSLQDLILEIPRGVSRLMDLLNDSREVIRNDTILLLNNLTKTNTNIQKIIAFESGFDRVMEIIEGEGSVIDGGIIVEDCFNLLLNLLQTNHSNQIFFKEANYIKMLCKYLDLSSAMGTAPISEGLGNELADASSTSVWTSQKVTNLDLLLRLIRCLVSPANQHAIVNDCQKKFSHFGLLHRLCALLTLPGVPSELLGEAISTVGEVIRGNTANQTLFSSVQMQTDPPRPIIVILLMSMINEKQPFHLRCSILYCFGCYLYKNEAAKTNIVETLLPKEQTQSQAQNQQISTGQILCTGLFSQNEVYSNWFCAVAILHTINDNSDLKEQLLRVQLAINPGADGQNRAVSLIQQCMNILKESTSSSQNQNVPNRYKFQTSVSILMLIATWLSNCSQSINYFLSQEQNIPYLISQVSSTDTSDKSQIIQGLSAFLLGLCMLYNVNQVEMYTVDKLRDIIKKRIGIEQFEIKLEFISQHELYTKTLKKPTFAFKWKQTNELLFDYEFTRLFKSNETLISNVLENRNISGFMPTDLTSAQNNGNESPMLNSHSTQNDQVVLQFQQIIREQDLTIQTQLKENQDISQKCNQLQENYKNLTSMLNEKHIQAEQLARDKVAAQAKINAQDDKLNFLENKCADQHDELSKLKRDKGLWQESNDNSIKTIDPKSGSASENNELKLQLKELNQEQENLLTLLQDMEMKLKRYKHLLKVCGQSKELSDSDDDEENDDEFDQASHKNASSFNSQFENVTIQPGTKISDSIKLNNNANFDYMNQNEEDDEQYQPNFMHQIIQSHDYSNNVSANHSGHNTHTENSSSQSSNSSNNGDGVLKNLPSNYPPPTGQNINSLHTNSQISDNSLAHTLLANNNLIKEVGTVGVSAFEALSIQNTAEANSAAASGLFNDDKPKQASDVNPFFMQHPFFNKQFNQEQNGITENSNDFSIR